VNRAKRRAIKSVIKPGNAIGWGDSPSLSPSPFSPHANEGPDKRVPPRDGNVCKRIRRGTLVVPAEAQWITQRGAADLTSRSLREADATSASLRNGPDKKVPPRDGNVCKRIRRGMLVMPAESQWIIQPGATDATSASLRNGPDKKVPPRAQLPRSQAHLAKFARLL
jgi:hypothetical protein